MVDREPADLETIAQLEPPTPVVEQEKPEALPDAIQSRAGNSLGGTVFKLLATSVGVLSATFTLALFEADSHSHEAKEKEKARLEQAEPMPSLAEETTPTTIAPAGEFKPDYSGIACYEQERTIKAGDTFFDLTTDGLHEDSYFMNGVFAWNLNHLKEQAQNNNDLANPNSIAIGQKIMIMANCIDVNSVFSYRDWNDYDVDTANPDDEPPLVYRRSIKYQAYPGTDGNTHNLVYVDYESNAQGEFLKVNSCFPDPECYNYVAGAPEAPEIP